MGFHISTDFPPYIFNISGVDDYDSGSIQYSRVEEKADILYRR